VALTDDQRLAVFEICGVPPVSPIRIQPDVWSGTPQDVAETYSAKVQLDAALAAMDAAMETRLVALLDEWDLVRIDVTDVVQGGLDGMPGVRDDPSAKRGIIARTVRTLLGYLEDPTAPRQSSAVRMTR
jgi:hypothetical protein